ncbi:alpha/beta hydrolase [Ktedonobacter sp. SOSP1-85]|uniref:alpha/beta hydrolase family protein n=1 Tax=Ktedonobacter sp. SOSP1-85 TaxID=2778367 RepID=UPI00191681E6|nr:hypothetical protein [Ktedonobacter sp. SOSP1-85]GHO81894.1 alpha/beta hydrolase [Ktedonobacter sp. SOSP1-85]
MLRAFLVLLLVFILVVVGCVSYIEIQRHHMVVLPAPTGPYAVGRTAYDWTDQARNDPLAPHVGTKRELVVWSWYPAAHVSGAQSVPYLPSKWAQASDNQLVQSSDSIQTHSIEDAPLATDATRYPVLIFEPGMGKIPTQYTTLLEDLASHGYIIFAITPTYSSDTVVFPDGRVAASTSAGNLDNATSLQNAGNQLVSVWAQDVTFVMDRLIRLNTMSGNVFTQHLDLTRLGVFGHSFGGATAAQVCHIDARCKASMDIDGDLFGDVLQAGLHKPFMVIQHDEGACSDTDCHTFQQGIQAVLSTVPRGAGYHISIKDTEHFNFSDYAVYFSMLRAFGMLGSIDGVRGVQITRAYVRAFFDAYLDNTPSPLLRGPASTYPEVGFRT